MDKEHNRMVENNAWKSVKIEDVPKDVKVLNSTWACKLKLNGTKGARRNNDIFCLNINMGP